MNLRSESALHIGIDASRAVATERTGTENYSLHLIRALVELAAAERPEHRFSLYHNRPAASAELPQTERCHQRPLPFPRLWTHLRLSLEMARHRPDVLFVPAHVIPLVHPRRSVVTIHDLGHLYYPQTYGATERLYLSLSTRYNARVARHIIADSEATKRDLVERLGVPPMKVSVVYPGVAGDVFYRRAAAEVAATTARYGIDGDYLLHLGTLKPRKNIERLLAAFALVADRHPTLRLALSGATRDASLRATASDRVIFTGYLPQADVPALISGATALVIPSLYEGFGLPALEALACGTPVVAANTSSLTEVVGDAGVLVNPLDVADIARGLSLALDDAALRRRLAAAGPARATAFTWRRAAERTLAALEAA